MFLPESGLPLIFDPFPGESGLGYCLRVLSRNGTDFHGLRRLLGIGEVTPISRSHAYETAKLLQVSIPWLQEALPDSHRTRTSVHRLFGHPMFARNHLRVLYPQVCAQCIHRYGYCRAAWELSLATVCVEHRCTLISCCDECGQALRWNRRSIDVGHCGHYIKFAPNCPPVSDDLLSWQKFVEGKFSSEENLRNAGVPGWLKILQPMTLGGIFVVVAAFGFIERPFAPISSSASVKKLCPSEWQAIVLRGISRLSAFQSGCDSKELSGLVAQHLLLRLLKGDVASVDLQTALGMLAKLFKAELDSHLLRQYPNLRQQQLF